MQPLTSSTEKIVSNPLLFPIRGQNTEPSANGNGHISQSSNGHVSLDPRILEFSRPQTDTIWPIDKQSAVAYLFSLTEKNIRSRNTPDKEAIEVEILEELKWLNSQKNNYLLKLAQIIKVIEVDKTRFRGTSNEAGGIRSLIPGIGAQTIFRIIGELHGITHKDTDKDPTFNKFSGTSAGAILAACMAAKVPIKELFKICENDFSQLPGNPEVIMKWVNDGLLTGYNRATGKNFKGLITARHLRELGTELYILLGIKGNYPAPFGDFFMKKTFFAPDSLTGSNAFEDTPIAWIVAASCNIGPLFKNSEIFNFKHPEITDDKQEYIVDPGNSDEYTLPLDLNRQLMLNDEVLFSVGSSKPYTNLSTYTFGRDLPLITRVEAAFYDLLCSFRSYWRDDYVARYIKQLGTKSVHVQTLYRTKDPQNPRRTIQVSTGTFAPPNDLKTLARNEMLRTIDQLHNSLVDETYLESSGTDGSCAYEIWEEGTKQSHGKNSARKYLYEKGLINASNSGAVRKARLLIKKGLAEVQSATKKAAAL